MSAKPTKPILDERITEALVNLGIYQTMKIPDTAHAMREMLRPAIKALIAEEVEAAIGADVTQQERHWSDAVWDYCGRGNTQTVRGCICEQLNGLKAEQRTVARERLGIKENER